MVTSRAPCHVGRPGQPQLGAAEHARERGADRWTRKDLRFFLFGGDFGWFFLGFLVIISNWFLGVMSHFFYRFLWGFLVFFLLLGQVNADLGLKGRQSDIDIKSGLHSIIETWLNKRCKSTSTAALH